MNAFEAARLTNDRVNGGDENKFPVTLAVAGEIILFCKLISGVEVGITIISSGDVDQHIVFLVNELDDENELKMMENVQNFFTPRFLHLVRNINQIKLYYPSLVKKDNGYYKCSIKI